MNWTLPINGAYRYDNGTMKVYTAQDVADIVRFAGNRGITVVPEFESPGHATVWGNAFPEMVSCANVRMSSSVIFFNADYDGLTTIAHKLGWRGPEDGRDGQRLGKTLQVARLHPSWPH